jgi:hypothetical protein
MRTLTALASLCLSTALVVGCGDAPAELPAIPTLEEFKATLAREPGEHGLYFVEDMRMSEAQVDELYQTYIANMDPALLAGEPPAGGEDIGTSEDALSVNQRAVPGTCTTRWVFVAGVWVPNIICTPPTYADDIWGSATRTQIRYCISNAFSREDKLEVARSMRQAAEAWEDVAGVRFVHAATEDAACNPTNINVEFEVAPDPVPNLAAARAAFPSVPRIARQLFISPITLDPPPPPPGQEWRSVTTTLTHELGHLLGFVHEHINMSQFGADPTCNWDVPTAYRQVTGYDADSIMHYSGCNGSTERSGDRVTKTDAAGARSLYGAPLANPHPCGHALWLEGAALDPLCNDVTAQVCALDAFCCDAGAGSWDGFCVNAVSEFI